MRKIVFFMDAGLLGTDQWLGYSLNDNVTNNELDSIAYELAMDHANSYGDVVLEDDLEDEDQISEADVNYSWANYNSADHDGFMLDDSFPEL